MQFVFEFLKMHVSSIQAPWNIIGRGCKLSSVFVWLVSICVLKWNIFGFGIIFEY